MRYLVEETNEIYNDIDDVLNDCIEDDYHDMSDDYFEEWINDVYGYVSIGNCEYHAYDVLNAMDDLYNFEEDYCESQNENDRENAYYELKHGRVGEKVYCQNYVIEIIDDETGDDDGDEDIDYVEMTRQYYDEQSCLMKSQEEREKEDEKDLMALFQRIGA